MKVQKLAALAAVSIVLSACGGDGGTSTATGSASLGPLPDVKIGLATSKTGAANFYNPQQTNGAQLAVDQFNATGGFQNGRQKIQLIVEDDGSTKDQGITVFKKFIEQDKVAAILGPTLSATAAGAHRSPRPRARRSSRSRTPASASSASATTARATGSSAPRSASRARCPRRSRRRRPSSVSRKS